MSKVTSQNTNFQIQNQQNQRETDLTQDKTQMRQIESGMEIFSLNFDLIKNPSRG
jgi:hypothetical protein